MVQGSKRVGGGGDAGGPRFPEDEAAVAWPWCKQFILLMLFDAILQRLLQSVAFTIG